MKPTNPEEDLGHDAYSERLLDRADHLRTEWKDREMEEAEEPQPDEEFRGVE